MTPIAAHNQQDAVNFFPQEIDVPAEERANFIRQELQLITQDVNGAQRDLITERLARIDADQRANFIDRALQLINLRMNGDQIIQRHRGNQGQGN